MRSLIGWAAKYIKSVMNTSATALFQFILNKFIDSPLGENSQFSFRNNWSVQIILKTLFLSPKWLSSFLPFLSFRTFYISAVQNEAEINLSKQRCKIDKMVIEVDFADSVKDIQKDQTAQTLFQNMNQEMPIKKEQTLLNWIFNYVESVEIEVSKITILIKIKEEIMALEIEGLTLFIDHSKEFLFSGEIRKIIMTLGSQRPLTTVLKLSHTNFIFLNDSLTLKSSKGTIDLTVPFINILAFFYKYSKNIHNNNYYNNNLVKNNNNNKSGNVSNNDFSFCIDIANVDLKVAGNFNGFGRNLEASFRNKYFDFHFESIETYHDRIPFLKAPEFSFSIFIPPSSTKYDKVNDCPFSDYKKAISWQNQLYEKEMIKFSTKIPLIEGNLSTKSCLDLISLITALRAFSGDDLMGLSVSIIVDKFSVIFDEILSIKLNRPHLSFFFDTMKNFPTYTNFSLSLFEIMIGDFIIAQNIFDTTIVFFQMFDDSKTKPILYANLSNIIFSIPYRNNRMVNTFQNPGNNKKNVSLIPNIDLLIKINNIFIDYVSKNQPARLINHISFLESSYNNGVGSFDSNISTYLSNMRCPLPLSLFSLESSLFFRYGFCEIAQFSIRDGSFDIKSETKNIIITQSNMVISMCSDSYEVLKSLLISIIETINDDNEKNENKKNNINSDEQNIYAQEIEQKLKESLLITQDELKCVEETDINFQLNENEQIPSFFFKCEELTLSFLLYGGRDLNNLFDLRTLSNQLKFSQEVIEPLEFELISLRNENECIEFVTTSSIELSTYDSSYNKKDDEITNGTIICKKNEEMTLINYNKNKKLHFKLDVKLCDVIDRIKNSMARLIFSTEFNGSIIFELDLLQRPGISGEKGKDNMKNHCRIMIELPKFGVFITNEQLSFLVNYFSKTRPFAPTLSSVSSSSNDAIIIDYFSLKGDSFCVSAHFKFYLNVSLEDVEMNIHNCILLSSRSISDLLGRVIKFYLLSIQKMSVISGLPVLNNLKRIGGAVRTLFSFDVEHLGIARGLGVSFGILMKTLATETLNASSCVTSTAENLIKFAIYSISGNDDREIGIHTAVATLIIAPKSKFEEKGFGAAVGEFIIQIPRVLLAPGVVALDSTSKMVRYLKKKVNPNERKERIYLKQ